MHMCPFTFQTQEKFGFNVKIEEAHLKYAYKL